MYISIILLVNEDWGVYWYVIRVIIGKNVRKEDEELGFGEFWRKMGFVVLFIVVEVDIIVMKVWRWVMCVLSCCRELNKSICVVNE